VPPSITYDSVAGIGTSWDVGGDHGNELRSHSREQDGPLQWDGGDADELERDQYRRAGVERSDLLVSALVESVPNGTTTFNSALWRREWGAGQGAGQGRSCSCTRSRHQPGPTRNSSSSVLDAMPQTNRVPFSIKGKACNNEPGSKEFLSDVVGYLQGFLDRYNVRLTIVFENQKFKLYEIRSRSWPSALPQERVRKIAHSTEFQRGGVLISSSEPQSCP
jgi:hypothetical protein